MAVRRAARYGGVRRRAPRGYVGVRRRAARRAAALCCCAVPCSPQSDAVALAAVVGVPHAHLGEEIAAAVVLWPGAHATPDELREFVKERVAAYKYPRDVCFVDTLPTGPSGKVLKREITAPTG